MTYFESAEDIQIDRSRVLHEIRRHGHVDPESELAWFIAEHGEHELYDAQAVLIWLGY